MEHLKTLKEICETLSKELDKANDKIRAAGGSITPADLEYLDKLTHSIKSVKTTVAMMEAEDDEQGSYAQGGSYARYGRPEYSYARGRRNASRDSMGRYSGERGGYSGERGGYSGERGGYSGERGYSRNGEMVDELYDLMEKAPDERTRQEMQRMISRMESM